MSIISRDLSIEWKLRTTSGGVGLVSLIGVIKVAYPDNLRNVLTPLYNNTHLPSWCLWAAIDLIHMVDITADLIITSSAEREIYKEVSKRLGFRTAFLRYILRGCSNKNSRL